MIEDPIIRDIPGYEKYQISENGEVYNKITGAEIPVRSNMDGYLGFTFRNNNKTKTLRIHRVLGLIFIPNPNNFPVIDHIDRDRQNNNLSNLRWVSHKMNSRNRNIRKDNGSKFTGIHLRSDGKHKYWRVRIYTDAGRISNNFPYTDEGLKQAIVWRKDQEYKNEYL